MASSNIDDQMILLILAITSTIKVKLLIEISNPTAGILLIVFLIIVCLYIFLVLLDFIQDQVHSQFLSQFDQIW